MSNNFKPKKKSMDDDDGPSRKIAGGGGGAGISFAPMTAPAFSGVSSPFDMSQMSTRPGKAAAMTAPMTAAPPAPSSSQFQWGLSVVPTLPEFHPLERTAAFCENTSAAQVASRVSTVLRQLSVEASYNDEKARVRCMSESGVDFRVRLYRGRGNYSHGLIVEVQRRFGYSIDFHDITNAILDAAQGLPVAAAVKRVAAASSNAIPMVSDAEDDDDDYMPPPPSSDSSSLKMIAKMFSNNGYDTYYLGLQTLASLTDASRMGAATARNVSMELLNPDNEVGAKLVDLIVKKQGQGDDEENVFNLRVMALSIMANALEAIKGEQLSPVLYEMLRPVWIQELKEADASNLLSAQHTARCLEFTWKQDHDFGELQDALEVAQEVGQARHAGLEKQARKTLANLI